MSKIQKELVRAVGIKPADFDDRQEFLRKLSAGSNKLSDAEFDELSQEAQDWLNNSADEINSKAKKVTDFPDAEEPKEETKSSRRRSAEADEDQQEAKGGTKKAVAEEDIKEGMVLQIVTKRGKDVSGHVVEVNTKKGFVAIKLGNGDEEEFDFDRIDKMYTMVAEEAKSTRRSSSKDEDAGPAKGDTVTVTTKRGKEITGKIVELDDEVIVLETDDGEEELSRDRVDNIKSVKGKTAKEEPKEEAKSSRRSSSKDEDDGKADTKEEKKRASNEGVSIGTRIKELIAEDLEASEEDIAKALKKEGLEFKENTLKLNYTDCHKFIAVLKKAKRLK